MRKDKVDIRKSIASCIFAFLITSAALADIKLPAIIGDNMVLQQGMQIPIWGKSDPGEKITITFAGQTKSAVADSNGKWLIHLDPIKAEPNQKPLSMTITANNTIKLNNILIGEVWLCSGQSNMVWSLVVDIDKKALDDINQPSIRIFNVNSINAAFDDPTKQTDITGQWQPCNGKTAANFSAVAYFFGLDLLKELKVPIALISNPVGGTPAEAWLSKHAIESDPQLKPILEKCDKYMAEEFSKVKQRYEKALADWPQEVEKAKAEGKTPPYKPFIPFSPQNASWPSNLYNTRVAPLIPFGIRGVIWYQGESNVSNRFAPAELYDKLFPALISDWRKNWNEGNFPFFYVEIAPCRYRGVAKELCAVIREAQVKTLSLPNTAMAGTMDIGEPNNIHPKNKWDVGKRLALCALAKTYGRNIVYAGPIYKSMSIENNQIRIRFSNAESGLILKGKKLTYFRVAGSDKKFVDANAVIDGDTVVVSSDKVSNPVAVRYGWQDDAMLNLFNKHSLPASPFRTDDWPAILTQE